MEQQAFVGAVLSSNGIHSKPCARQQRGATMRKYPINNVPYRNNLIRGASSIVRNWQPASEKFHSAGFHDPNGVDGGADRVGCIKNGSEECVLDVELRFFQFHP